MFWGKSQRLWAMCFLGVALLLGTGTPASASLPPKDPGSQTFFLPVCPPKTSLEMQVGEPRETPPTLSFSLGDKLPALPTAPNLGSGAEGLDKNSRQMTAKFQFNRSAELRVSFLYNQDQPSGQSPLGPTSQLLFRYTMDYCVMPTLKVGISGYLYKPPSEYFTWRNNSNFSDPVYGIGPGVQYDLGRWSFLLRSQLEHGAKDRGEALHNWFRVWYAF